jgi:hypothetical protein
LEHDVAEWKRGGEINLASLSFRMAQGKTIVAEIQAQMAAAHVEQHGHAVGLTQTTALVGSGNLSLILRVHKRCPSTRRKQIKKTRFHAFS